MKSRKVTVSLTEEQYQVLQRLADEEMRTIGMQLRWMLKELFAETEGGTKKGRPRTVSQQTTT